MITEEEIRKHYIFSTKHELDDNNKMLKKYVEQLEKNNYSLTIIAKAEIEQRERLETEKQNLIEKLEEEIKTNKERYSTVSEDLRLYVRGKIDCINEILSYMKGEEK